LLNFICFLNIIQLHIWYVWIEKKWLALLDNFILSVKYISWNFMQLCYTIIGYFFIKWVNKLKITTTSGICYLSVIYTALVY
jgi:hypothetical protein